MPPMIVSINQPYYLPWCGFFDRIKRSDLHIVLDHVQLEKGGYSNRTRIRQRDGREAWLTIPVEKGQRIWLTRIRGEWRRKHTAALEQAYGLSLDGLLPDSEWLSDVLDSTTAWLLGELGIEPHFVWSEELGGGNLGRKSALILNLCKEVGATQYLSGAQGRNYLDIPAFEEAGIEVIYHQLLGDKPTLDYLFNSKEQTWPQPLLTLPDFSHNSEAEALAAPAVRPLA